MRLHVHARGVDFVTCSEEGSTVFELRQQIEAQYSALNRTAPPLATHALKDKQDYFLPDTLRVGDVLSDGDHVFPVLERELKPAAEADLTQVLSRWRYFQTYTIHAMSAAVHAKIKDSNGDAPITVDTGSVHVLVEMLTSLDENQVRLACSILRKVLCPPHGKPENLGPCFGKKNSGLQCAKWICTLGLYVSDESIANDCATILTCLLNNQVTKSATIDAGAGAALVHLSRSKNAETRQTATSGLLLMTHNERKESVAGRQFNKTAWDHCVGSLNSKRIVSASESKLDMMLGLDDAIATLESSEMVQVQRLALETILRETGDDSLRRIALLEGNRLVQAFRRVCRTADSIIAPLVADIFVELSNKDDESKVVHRLGGFELLTNLVEEEEETGRFLNREQGTHSATESELLLTRFRTIVHNRRHPCPLKLLVDTLLQSSSFRVREVVAENLLNRVKQDDSNEFFSFIPMLLSAATQAPRDGSNEVLHLARVLSVLSVKQVNKPKLIKYGAISHLSDLLAMDERMEVQRTASKALANLATSSDRAVVIEALHRTGIALDSFHDSITAMYLEMIFIPD